MVNEHLLAADGKPIIIADEDRVFQYIKHPQIPVPKESHIIWRWLCLWLVATTLILFVFVPPIWGSLLYTSYDITIDDLAYPPDLDIELAGCDVHYEHGSHNNFAVRLGFWNYLSDGESFAGWDLNRTYPTIKVRAAMTKKVQSMHCLFTVLIPHIHLAENETHFRNLNLIINKDANSLLQPHPSNVAENIRIKLRDTVFSGNVNLMVHPVAEVHLQGVIAPHIDATIGGGGILQIDDDSSIHNRPSGPMHINAGHSMLFVNLHRSDMDLTLKNGTFASSILAADRVAQGVNDGDDEVDRYTLYGGHQDNGSPVEVHVTGESSALYFLAHPHLENNNGVCPDLDVVTGENHDTKQLLPEGDALMSQLIDWLNTGASTKYAVYMYFPMPAKPSEGMLELLSTPAYEVFSLTTFSLLSGSMLSPDIVRIMTPMLGFTELFPYYMCDPSRMNTETYGSMIQSTVAQSVDIASMENTEATWVWDPAGPAEYIFTLIPGRFGTPPAWNSRPLAHKDVWNFLCASGITLILGLVIGLVLLWVMNRIVKPRLLNSLNDLEYTNSASYRLSHTTESALWAISGTFLMHPVRGVMLRWKKREMSPRFATLTFEARPWPMKQGDKVAKIPGVDPLRLPMFPRTVDQQCFIMTAKPQRKTEAKMDMLEDRFESELKHMAALSFASGQGKTASGDFYELATGKPYQCRVVAFDANGSIVEKSSYTRPVSIRGHRAFTEYPLLLWRSFVNIVPQDTFSYFLRHFCFPTDASPTCNIKFSNIKVVMKTSEPSIFVGAYSAGYGDFDDSQSVNIEFSTGLAGALTAADALFESTTRIPLPGASQKAATPSLKKSFVDAVYEGVKPEQFPPNTVGMHNDEYIILDYKDQEITVAVGMARWQNFHIEAVLNNVEGRTDKCANLDVTWDEIMGQMSKIWQHMPGDADGKRGAGKLTDELVLRDGATALGIFQADFKFVNTVLGPAKKCKQSKFFPGVFDNVLPCVTYLYGETITLTWGDPEEGTANVPEWFDIRLKTHSILPKDNYDYNAGNDNETFGKVVDRCKGSLKKIQMVLTPDSPSSAQAQQCRLEVLYKKPGEDPKEEAWNVDGKSPEILLIRPVSMQDLELGYASFCIRNGIRMEPVGATVMESTGYPFSIQVVQNTFWVASGYRPPMTTPGEDKAYDETNPNHFSLIKNALSNMIWRHDTLMISKKEKGAKEKSMSLIDRCCERISPTTRAVESPDAAAQEVAQNEKCVPKRVTMSVPTNVFWKRKISWNAELLLTYGCMPTFAQPGYFTQWFEVHDMPRVAYYFGFTDDFFRILFSIWLYVLQMLSMSFPVILLVFGWIFHDIIWSNTDPDLLQHTSVRFVFFLDWAFDPTWRRWNLLENTNQIVIILASFYLIVVVFVSLYCNFLHDLKPMCNHRNLRWVPSRSIMFHTANSSMILLSAISFSAMMLYITVVLVWVIMGALIDPLRLMPYALMIVIIATIVHSSLSTLRQMRDAVMGRVHEKLDLIMHALMECFVADPQATVDIDQAASDFVTLSRSISENMSQGETDIREDLFSHSPNIMKAIDGVTASRIAKLRASSRFTTPAGLAENKCLATDFLPVDDADKAALIAKAQKMTNDDATLDDTRVALDKNGNQWDNDLEASALMMSIAKPSGTLVPRPGEMSPEEQAAVNSLAQSMNLRPATAQIMHAGYTLALHQSGQKQAESDGPLRALSNALFCAELISEERENKFFKHFSEKYNTETEAKSDDAEAGMCTAMGIVKEIQNEEMDTLVVKATAALTAKLDWTTVSRQGNLYATSVLPSMIVTNAIDKQLNVVERDSAAFNLIMKAYDILYEKFDASYKNDPVQAFVDLGVIEQATKNSDDQACKDMVTELKSAVAFQANFDGSTGAVNLLRAVKSVCLFENQVGGGDDQAGFSYLWLGALKAILVTLGWTKEEMEDTWLRKRWTDLTEGGQLLKYQGLDEINTVIMELCDGGMWRAGMKGLMLNVGVGGYLGCDVCRDGAETATSVAGQIEWMDQRDLKEVATLVVWPDYAEELYTTHASKAEGFEAGDPRSPNRFMPVARFIDFMKDIIYDDESWTKHESEYLLQPLNLYSNNVADMQWRQALPKDNKVVGTGDGAIWHALPDGSHRRLRGMWLEVAFEMFANLDCIPHNMDIFFKAVEYEHTAFGGRGYQGRASRGGMQGFSTDQVRTMSIKSAGHKEILTPFLQLKTFEYWLKHHYLKERHWITLSQFKKLLGMLNCDLNLDKMDAVFAACPGKPGDLSGDLRNVQDLGSALYIWMGYGLWPKAVENIVEHFLPRGPMRSLALSMLQDEFNKLDLRGAGVIQPAETIALIHRLMNPGLTCENLADFLSSSLDIDCPVREIHKYFTLMDVDGNGVLSVDEFIPMFRMLILGYFPEHILRSLNLSPGKIAQFLLIVVFTFLAVFILITLVITTFAAGRDIISVIHSGVTGCAGVMQNSLGNQNIGLESGMTDLLAQLEGWVMTAIITCVGLSKSVVDRLETLAEELAGGVMLAGSGAVGAVENTVEAITGTGGAAPAAPAAASSATPAAGSSAAPAAAPASS